jgi:aerobic-type carbon monoxide dehydrogenase small subunit (CoxS/CutS family)
MVRLTINGKSHTVDVEADTPLLWVIREHVGLTGTKYGCGVAQCGACSVHINGEVRRSCSIPVGDVKATGKQTLDPLRQGRGCSGQAHAAGSQDHQAQGSEGLEDRWQAAQTARYRGQAQWQQGLCHRSQAA